MLVEICFYKHTRKNCDVDEVCVTNCADYSNFHSLEIGLLRETFSILRADEYLL